MSSAILICLFRLGVKNLLEPFKSVPRNSRSIPAPPMHRNALEINSLRNLSVPTHQIFRKQFPQHFTMLAAAKYVNYTGGYLISFYDSQDRLQIGIKISKTSVALEYAQAGKRNQFLAFNVEVIDRKWHRFAFSVGNGRVSFYFDCEEIGTRNITQESYDQVDRRGNIYLNAKAEPPEQNENLEVRRFTTAINCLCFRSLTEEAEPLPMFPRLFTRSCPLTRSCPHY